MGLGKKLFYWTFILLCFGPGLALALVKAPHAPNTVEVVKSESDQRQYRYLQLANHLKVLLVSDPSTDKAAAALDVYVGSAQDPVDREGLAHFLEHMLFLGTEGYPQAGEYQAFISQNGGSHNAYTSPEHTNYFFDIKAGQLEPALDRFAQFFVAPLFTAKYVDRERHAVHSEYQSKIKDDYRRILDVYRQQVNPAHPMAKFSVGSLDTLADRGDDLVRDDLLAFYQRYYSADVMTLVVLGRESLDQLEAMVDERFTAISSHKVEALNHGSAMFTEGFLPAQVEITPEKDQRRLSLIFPVPADREYYRQKPLQYLGNLLGHEGEGSLLSLLKKQGWAEGLSAGSGFSDRAGASFNISINLTEKGLAAREQIIALVFQTVELIRRAGVESWRFAEQQQLGNIAFRFQEKGEPIHTVSALANRMHSYAAEDILRGPYLFQSFDQALIEKYLAHLRPDNVFVSVSAAGLTTDRQTERYRVPYRVVSRSGKSVPKKLARVPASLRRQLHLPEANTFIPQQLKVKSAPILAGTETRQPQQLKQTDRFRAWFKQDRHFQVPRASILLRIKSPVAADSAHSAAQMQLFVALVKDALNEFSYPASLAGLHFALESNSRGFDIEIGGYNDRQGLLLTRIIEAVTRPDFHRDRFDNVKRELLRNWRNVSKQPPYVQLLKDVPVLLFQPYWSESELIASLEGDKLGDIKQFSARLLNDASIDVLIYGNLYREEGLKLAALIENQMLSDDEGPVLAKARVIKLPGGGGGNGDEKPWLKALPVEHRDNAVALYVQGMDDSLIDAAHMMVLQQVLRAPFFHELRTERQLGYIVFSSAMSLKEVPGSVLVVQSPTATPSQLISEISAFIERFAGQLPDDLSKHQQAVIHQLLEQPKNLAEQSQHYWSNILHENLSFDRRQRLAEAVEGVSVASFKDYYQRVLQNGSRRVWLTSRELSGGQQDFAVIAGDDTFGVGQPVYTYP